MQRIGRITSILLLLAALAACAIGPRVRTDMDPDADFSRYRSWSFYEPLAMEESGYSTYLTQRIRSSIRREMEARGYRVDETDPDLLVNFQGVIRERTDVYSIPRSDVSYFYSYRARRYVGVPVWYDETEVRQYTQGTLTVDLVDADRNHLVWTGAAMGRVTQQAPRERAAEAERAISAIFEQFPFDAAGSRRAAPAP